MSETNTVVVEVQSAPTNNDANNAPQKETKGIGEKLKGIKNKSLPGIRVGLSIMTLVYLAMFVLGCMNVKKCPVNANIPLYLTAAGAIGVVTRILTVIKSAAGSLEKYLQEAESFLYGLEGVFFILGSYWVYSEYMPSFDPEIEPYCNKTAYLVAFWFITAHYIVLLMFLFGLCCILVLIMCTKSNEETPKEDVESQKDTQKDTKNKNTE